MPIRIKEIYYLKLLISVKTQNLVNKNKKDTLESLNALCKGREMALSAFKNRLFPLNPTEGIKPRNASAHTWGLWPFAYWNIKP